jgi:hypothetical protein
MAPDFSSRKNAKGLLNCFGTTMIEMGQIGYEGACLAISSMVSR